MSDRPSVILSGFGDEAANEKLAVQQFAAFAALGLKYYSIRFIDVGEGIKNVMMLTPAELKKVKQMQAEYGLSVATIGSPIGKVKLLDVDDGTAIAMYRSSNTCRKTSSMLAMWPMNSAPS